MTDPSLVEYLIRPDHTVLEIHGGWDAFARENQAETLHSSTVVGRQLDEFVADDETRAIYAALVDRVLQTGEPIRFTYRCDGPSCRRHMAMEIDLVASEIVRFRSRTVREEARTPQPLLDPEAPRSDEMIVMCGWCKRVESAGEGWLDVEDYVARSGLLEASALPALSHGICPHCEDEMDRLVDSAA